MHLANTTGSVNDRALIVVAAHRNCRTAMVIGIKAGYYGGFDGFVAHDIAAGAHLVVDEVRKRRGTPRQCHPFEETAAIAGISQQAMTQSRRTSSGYRAASWYATAAP